MANPCKKSSPQRDPVSILRAIFCLIQGLVTGGAVRIATTTPLNVYDADSAPALNAAAVVPSDSTTWSVDNCRSLFVGGGGNVVATMASVDVIFTDVPDGTWLPIRPTHIKAATTATNIVRVW